MPVISFFFYWLAPYMRGRFGRSNRGASLVEYLLLVTLIALVCLASIMWFGNSTSTGYNDVGSTIGAT